MCCPLIPCTIHVTIPQTSCAVREHCGFVVNLSLSGTEVVVEPNKDTFKKALSNVLEEIIKVSMAIPRLERRMYPEMEVGHPPQASLVS